MCAAVIFIGLKCNAGMGAISLSVRQMAYTCRAWRCVALERGAYRLGDGEGSGSGAITFSARVEEGFGEAFDDGGGGPAVVAEPEA